MWYFTEVADWFERKRSQSDNILDKWVEDSNYSQGVMIIASTTKGFTTFGAGFVDLLRIGDGIKQDTLKGVGTDALRLIAIFPFGKATQMLKSAKGVSIAKVIIDTGGPNCFWVASAKAFAQISHRHKGNLFASVEDLAKALNMSMDNLWKIPNLFTGISYLKKIGARIGKVMPVSTLKDIAHMLPSDGSVVMIAVNVMKDSKVIGGHAIYAFRNSFRQVRFMDRTVGRVTNSGAQGMYKSIEDIAPMYGASALVPYEAAVIQNVFVKSIAYDGPKLVIPLLGVVATEDVR